MARGDVPVWAVLLAGGVAAVGLYWWARDKSAASLSRSLVTGAAGVASGAVVGAGEVLGIPATAAARCTCAIANGENYEASKYCSAGVFLAWQVGKKPYVLKRTPKGAGVAIWPDFDGKAVVMAARPVGGARWVPVPRPVVMPAGWQSFPAW